MPIQVVDMTTLLNISGISSGSEVNVTTENCMKPMFEGKVERGTFAYLHTEERESKSLSKRKTAGKGTKYFYTSLFGICEFTFVVTDTPKLLPLVNSGQN